MKVIMNLVYNIVVRIIAVLAFFSLSMDVLHNIRVFSELNNLVLASICSIILTHYLFQILANHDQERSN